MFRTLYRILRRALAGVVGLLFGPPLGREYPDLWHPFGTSGRPRPPP
jgi:hypothetical protein